MFKITKLLLVPFVLLLNFYNAKAQTNFICADAKEIISGFTCNKTQGTLYQSPSTNTNICGNTARRNAWYKFVAKSPNPTILLQDVVSITGARIQLLSGPCGGTSISCANSTINATNLVIGNTYYIRVYTTSTTTPSINSAFSICVTDPYIESSRMKEVFKMEILSGINQLNDPWEITYGPDGYLWVNEARGYKVHRMDPNTGTKTTVLDLAQGASGYLTATQHNDFNVQFSSSHSPWPQGGFAGLAVHPKFLDPVTPKNYVYVSYVRTYTGGSNGPGHFFVSRIVRFTYNTGTNKLQSPVSLVDTLPGSNDHNSQRMIIAPHNGVDYLFYACGDMGAGQFDNRTREIKSQINASYEGKILRFNLESDGDADTFDRWIPNDNPFNGAKQSAVWSTGMRNNQGFAYAVIDGVGKLYGSSHGPFSDDEVNIIEPAKNYGHPIVIGFAGDNNYNSVKAGSTTGSLPLITSETSNASAIGSSYKDPIYSGYAPSNSYITATYANNGSNAVWPSEGWSGMDIYTHSAIPGWKNSLLVGSLKWGRVLRMKLNEDGTQTVNMGGYDSLSYFGSRNRYRDVAIDPDGKTIYVIMDKSPTTSGPSANNPSITGCAGCVQKYTFLGYTNTGTERSNIPSDIKIAAGTDNNCEVAGVVNINDDNNNLWVPLTDNEGNIIAEIKANGNNLGNVTTSFFVKSGTLREDSKRRLLVNRNISITPAVQPSTPVSIRLYLTAAELSSIIGATNSTGASAGVSSINNIRIMKNNDGCGASLTGTTTVITPTYAEAHDDGYVLHASVSSFSSFYFTGQDMLILPQQIISFNGKLKNDDAELVWEIKNEESTSHYEIERSIDGNIFTKAGTVHSNGDHTGVSTYLFRDLNVVSIKAAALYYRLKVVSLDGKITYSKIVLVPLNNNYSVFVYPNPVKDLLSIRLNLATQEQLSIEVSDMQGRIVYKGTRQAGNGATDLNIDTKSWSTQLYSVSIFNSANEVIYTTRVVKM